MRSGRSDDPLMGTMRLTLPGGMTAETARRTGARLLAGGPDNMPWPTDLRLTPTLMTATRDEDDSGYLIAPWPSPAPAASWAPRPPSWNGRTPTNFWSSWRAAR